MIYNKYKGSLMAPLITATIKVAVLSETYVPNQAHEFFSDVNAHEIAITGYIAGGQVLANKTLVETLGLFKFSGDNPFWAITGSVSFKHAVFYIDTGNPATSRLITFHTFPVLRTVINSSLTFEIPNSGIFSLQ